MVGPFSAEQSTESFELQPARRLQDHLQQLPGQVTDYLSLAPRLGFQVRQWLFCGSSLCSCWFQGLKVSPAQRKVQNRSQDRAPWCLVLCGSHTHPLPIFAEKPGGIL